MADERVILPEWIKEGGGAAPVPETDRQYKASMNVAFVSQNEVDALMESIVAVCRAHNLWIGHEDQFGAFVVQKESTEEWLREARSGLS